MARRKKRSASARSKKAATIRNDAGPPTGAETALPLTARLSAWSPALIVGGFSILSLLVLANSLPGYQIARRTRLIEDALEERRYEEASKHLLYVTEIYPTAWVRLTQLGDCYLELDRPEQAMKVYRESLAQNKEQRLTTRIAYATFLIDPDSDTPEPTLLEAIEADPNDSEAQYYLGLIYMHRNQFLEAAPRFQAASVDAVLFEKARPHIDEIRRQILGD